MKRFTLRDGKLVPDPAGEYLAIEDVPTALDVLCVAEACSQETAVYAAEQRLSAARLSSLQGQLRESERQLRRAQEKLHAAGIEELPARPLSEAERCADYLRRLEEATSAVLTPVQALRNDLQAGLGRVSDSGRIEAFLDRLRVTARAAEKRAHTMTGVPNDIDRQEGVASGYEGALRIAEDVFGATKEGPWESEVQTSPREAAFQRLVMAAEDAAAGLGPLVTGRQCDLVNRLRDAIHEVHLSEEEDSE